MKKYPIWGAITGLIIPLLLLPIPQILDLAQYELVKSIYYFCLPFFWPTSIALMAFHGNSFGFQEFLTLVLIVGINIGFYVFLGWLVWLGASKNKIFFTLPPAILFFIYFIFWDLID